MQKSSYSYIDTFHNGRAPLRTGVLASLLSISCCVDALAAPGCLSTFLTAPFFDAGASTRAVAMADLDGDGNLDIVVANSGGNDFTTGTLSVLLGRGDGAFQPALEYEAGPRPRSLALADFNGDGQLDVAVANSAPSQRMVSVLLGRGGARFDSPRSSDAGGEGRAVAAADFNADGKVDLAVANSTWGTVSILRGKGDGTFHNPVGYPVNGMVEDVATGDFNRDGHVDLAAVNLPENNRGGASVLLGRGDATFQSPVRYTGGEWVTGVAVADLNADGKLDLALANMGNAASGGSVSVLLGNDDGTFQDFVAYSAGRQPQAVVAADFDGDGRLDLAAANFMSGDISVLSGSGYGAFRPAVSYGAAGSAWQGPSLLAVGDVNGDGRPDLARTGLNTVSVLLATPNGPLKAPMNYAAGVDPVSIVTGDFNGDQNADLAVANSRGAVDFQTPGTVAILLGTGGGSFLRAGNYTAGYYTKSLLSTDLDGNRRSDLVAINSGHSSGGEQASASVLLNNRDGVFDVAHYDLPRGSRSAAAGDFNGDGSPDLAIVSPGMLISFITGRYYYTNGSLSMLLGNGDGTLRPAVSLPVPPSATPWAVTATDFNGDGKLDLAVGDSTFQGRPGVSILRGNGDATFQTNANFELGVIYSLVAHDFNGDGKPDLAASGGYSNGIAVVLGNGDGTFQSSRTYGLGNIGTEVYSGAITALDLNSDGKPDLAAVSSGGFVSVLFGNGDGTFQSATAYGACASPGDLTFGDFNNDAKPDVAVANRAGALILLNTCVNLVDLRIVRESAGFSISWPAESASLVLEATASMASPNWQAIGAIPTRNQDRLGITLPLDQPARFFRLRK